MFVRPASVVPRYGGTKNFGITHETTAETTPKNSDFLNFNS
jgi:hypothetical protein